MKRITFLPAIAFCILCSCGQNSGSVSNGTNGSTSQNDNSSGNNAGNNSTQANFVEGKDYQLFDRVRLMDKVGFTEPAEAYSILLPKGWTSDGDIVWNNPGTSCAGTYKKLKASSPDGKYVFEILPDVLYTWHSDPQLMQFQSNSGNCLTGEPMKAETYLRNVLAQELGGAEVISAEENAAVVEYIRQQTQKAMAELQQYGAGQMSVEQSAINGKLKFNDGSEGMVTLGINSIYSTVPNVYNGTSSQFTTSQVMQRTIFKYPAGQSEQATKLFSLIMSSFRSNPAWNDAVNNFWKQARQQSHTAHLGRIRMIDERTRQIGEQAIRSGQQRLSQMDNQMRTWEAGQNSQDRMHTEFIKTIRGVENFQDETGKYEMTAGYNHVWSRGDGSSFILSDNPNFNAASVMQDQNWKQMKKVH